MLQTWENQSPSLLPAEVVAGKEGNGSLIWNEVSVSCPLGLDTWRRQEAVLEEVKQIL